MTDVEIIFHSGAGSKADWRTEQRSWQKLRRRKESKRRKERERTTGNFGKWAKRSGKA